MQKSSRARRKNLSGAWRQSNGTVLPSRWFICISDSAFSLLEVMIALGIFFIAIFAILDLTSRNLRAARSLQPLNVDASSLAGELSLTNRLEEGPLPSDLISQFEDLYPGYTCHGEIYEVFTNGLFQVDFEVVGVKERTVVASTMSILLYRPASSGLMRPGGGRPAGGGR